MDKVKEDLSTLILTDKEREFFKERHVQPSLIPDHAKDIFIIIGFLADLLTLTVIFMHISDIIAHSRTLAAWVAR